MVLGPDVREQDVRLAVARLRLVEQPRDTRLVVGRPGRAVAVHRGHGDGIDLGQVGAEIGGVERRSPVERTPQEPLGRAGGRGVVTGERRLEPGHAEPAAEHVTDEV